MFRLSLFIVLVAVIVMGPGSGGESQAAPIQRIRGAIAGVGDGYLLLKPDDGSAPRKFILRWKVSFVPPKLPLKGDKVLILYKDKEDGSIIYGVRYLGASRKPGRKNRSER